MDPMRWLRKHNKKILTFLVVFIAVMFTVPSIMGRNRDGSEREFVIGQYQLAGEIRDFTNQHSEQAGGELEVLDRLGLNVVLSLMPQIPGESGLPAMAEMGISMQTLEMMDRLLSTRRGISEDDRDGLVSSLEGDDAEKEDLIAAVDSYVGMSKGEVGRYYWLLLQEAHQHGFTTTPEQLQNVLSAHRFILAQERFPVQRVEDVCRNNTNVTERKLYSFIGNYIAVLRYAESVSSGPGVSERQLQKLIRDEAESQSVTGTFVTFSDYHFRNEVAAPTDAEISEQFEAYKAFAPGRAGEDNPFGFGYKLPDRAQLEYIRVSIKQLYDYYQEQFNAQAPAQREEAVLAYWEDNKAQFRRQKPTPDGAEQQQPEYFDPPFDEVADSARDNMLWQQAKEKADVIINTLRQMTKTPVKDATETLTLEQRREQASDYIHQAATLTDQVKAELGRTIDIVAAKTGYLSAEDIGRQFPGTMQIRRNRSPLPLEQLVFRAEPFRAAGMADSADALDYYEDAGEIYKGYGNRVNDAYLMRVIGADQARVASSPLDDGSMGASGATDAAVSTLREKIIKDIQRKLAFEKAQEQAQAFARAAVKDWPGALKQANDQMRKDPNAPDVLRESTLEQIHQNIEQYSRYQYMQQQVMQDRQFLMQVVDFSHEEASPDMAPFWAEKEEFCCHVFKDIKTTPPTRQDYLRRKPLAAKRMSEADSRSLLVHFSPRNIDLRMQYALKESTGEEGSAPEKADEAAM